MRPEDETKLTAAAAAPPADDELTLEDIERSEDLGTDEVPVPEWKTRSGADGTVTLKILPAGDALKFSERLQGPGKKEALLQIVQMCAVKKDGVTPLFPDDRSMAMLRKKALPVLLRLQKRALVINGLLDEKKADATVKND